MLFRSDALDPDLFEEAGFKDVHVLWETADAKGNGTGKFRRDVKATPDRSWIAYVVGRT